MLRQRIHEMLLHTAAWDWLPKLDVGLPRAAPCAPDRPRSDDTPMNPL